MLVQNYLLGPGYGHICVIGQNRRGCSERHGKTRAPPSFPETFRGPSCPCPLRPNLMRHGEN